MNFRKTANEHDSDPKQQRAAMVDGYLKPNGITDKTTLDAFYGVCRAPFAPGNISNPYMDQMIKINDERMIFSPLTLALIFQHFQPHDKRILSIGCNYGYTLAIAEHFTQHFYGVEEDITMFSNAMKNMKSAEKRIFNSLKRLIDESPKPFDLIIIEGAIEQVGKSFFNLLDIGGTLACLTPVGDKHGLCSLTFLTKTSEGMTPKIIYDTPGIVMKAFKEPEKFTF